LADIQTNPAVKICAGVTYGVTEPRPDRRGRKSSLEDLIPEDRETWAREIWANRAEIAKLPSGAWILREAAKVLGLTEEALAEVLRPLRAGT
jgi:hypothetical protein